MSKVDPARLRPGEWIAVLAAVGLLLTMLMPWFEAPDQLAARSALRMAETLGLAPTELGPTSGDAWQTLRSADLLLALAASVVIAAVALVAAGEADRLPVRAGGVVTVAGIGASAIVVYRVIVPVQAAGRQAGLLLAVAASAAVLLGGLRMLGQRPARQSASGRGTACS